MVGDPRAGCCSKWVSIPSHFQGWPCFPQKQTEYIALRRLRLPPFLFLADPYLFLSPCEGGANDLCCAVDPRAEGGGGRFRTIVAHVTNGAVAQRTAQLLHLVLRQLFHRGGLGGTPLGRHRGPRRGRAWGGTDWRRNRTPGNEACGAAHR